MVVEDSEVCFFQNSEDSEIPKEYAHVFSRSVSIWIIKHLITQVVLVWHDSS